VALFYDWWSIFVRLAEPDWHREAITSRPLLLHAIASRAKHARQTTITISSLHAQAIPAARALHAVALFLRGFVANAEQLTHLQRWRAILARASRPSSRAGHCACRRASPPPDATHGRKTPRLESAINANCGF
jgi:hypothetical protein